MKKNKKNNSPVVSENINSDDNLEQTWEKIKQEPIKKFKERFVFKREKNYLTDPGEKRLVAIEMARKNLNFSLFLLFLSIFFLFFAAAFSLQQSSPVLYGMKLNGELYKLKTLNAEEAKNQKTYKIETDLNLNIKEEGR